jgi:SAM-dependent methyltransferase
MQNPQEIPRVATLPAHRPHVCPWWLGWTLVFPARRWFLNPETTVAPLVKAGQRVLEVGPGTGFLTVPLAKRVGQEGRVFCVDLQPRMLTALERRLSRRGLAERVITRVCQADDLCVPDLADSMDLAVLVYMVHEVPDPARTLAQAAATLRPGGRLLIIEPKGHCSPELFAEELRIVHALGLVSRNEDLGAAARIRQAALFERPGGQSYGRVSGSSG